MVWVRNRETVTDWGEILFGASLPRGIQPSDIDGILHIGGPMGDRFLVMERKQAGEPMLDGQQFLLERLARQGAFSVIVILHGPDGVEEIENLKTGRTHKTSPAEFIRWIERWCERAEREVGNS